MGGSPGLRNFVERKSERKRDRQRERERVRVGRREEK